MANPPPPQFLPEQQMPPPKSKKPDLAGNFQSLNSKVTETESRLRVLEERYGNIRKKTQLTDQNVLEFEKEFTQEMKVVMSDLTDLKRTLATSKEKLEAMTAELDKMASKYDLKVLERYLDLWQPLEFVQKPEMKQERLHPKKW
tara:strand:- start:580 stop:1011 length:432 start_codon:yes stop_codon:yes gene_type:complete